MPLYCPARDVQAGGWQKHHGQCSALGLRQFVHQGTAETVTSVSGAALVTLSMHTTMAWPQMLLSGAQEM